MLSMEPKTNRKIIHIDADCFYAAIEMRDDPNLRHRPIAVGGSSTRRGVISTCNYEARRFGVHSAMSSAHALRLCPDLIIVPGNMEKYRQASQVMREIFFDYTELVEPLSLDEAYLDVSECEKQQGSATRIAEEIRARVCAALNITVSAGVAPNKFLAKIASDWNKPNGLFVVTPKQVDGFVKDLPVKKIHGVGKVTTEKLKRHGIETCSDIRAIPLQDLTRLFGSFGLRLHELALGLDNREVKPHRVRKSLSVERTFAEDLASKEQCLEKLPGLLEEYKKRAGKLGKEYRIAKAFVKVKFNDFTSTTLERVGTSARISDYHGLLTQALERQDKPVRLLGIGVRFFQLNDEFEQLELFEQ